MKLRNLLLAVPLMATAFTPAHGALFVDFGTVTTAGVNSPVAAGASSGNVLNNPSSGAGPITYVDLSGLDTGGFGTAAVQGVVTMSSGDIPNNTFRAINRTPGAKTAAQNPGLNNNTPNDPLFRDWIGVTQSSTLDMATNIITLNPSPTLTFTVSGIQPGEYVWTSWHHDVDDQTGLIDYEFTDALGVTTGTIDISHGANSASGANTGSPANNVNGRGPAVNGTGDPLNNPPGTPTSFSRTVIVDASGTFSFAMRSGMDPSLLSPTDNLPFSTTSQNFAIINGFELVRVPEPSTVALLGSFAAIATVVVRRRTK